MPVVRLRGPLKRLAGDSSEHLVDGATVVDLLRELERRHPATGGWILDERGLIRRHINVFVNGEPGGAETAVAGEDKVDVLPAISGGAARSGGAQRPCASAAATGLPSDRPRRTTASSARNSRRTSVWRGSMSSGGTRPAR